MSYLVETFKAAISSMEYYFMKPANSFMLFSIVMCNVWHSLQLVEGGQYLVEAEVDISLFYSLTFILREKHQIPVS